MYNYDNKEFVYDVLRFMADSDFCHEEITIRYDFDEPVFWVNCSDLHYWGIAYGVKLTSNDLPLLKECVEIDPIHGHLLFCCKVYNMRPQGAYYEYLESDMWLEFDKCGPLRKAGFTNPDIQKFNDETWNYNLQHYANEMFEYFTYPYMNYSICNDNKIMIMEPNYV